MITDTATQAAPSNPHPGRSCDRTCDVTDKAHGYGGVFTATQPAPVATREQAFTDIALAIAEHDLPVPMTVDIHDDGGVVIRVRNNHQDDVEQWARHLGLPLPVYGDLFAAAKGYTGAWRSYNAEAMTAPYNRVWSACDFDTDGGAR